MLPGFETFAEGLGFPEGPVAMADGSVLFVDIKNQTLSRARPGGKIETVAHLGGGPNGLAIGPDGFAYVCNNGGVYAFEERPDRKTDPRPTTPRITIPAPGPPPKNYKGGSIQRVDLATGKVTHLYDSCGGQRLLAPDDIVFDTNGGFWFTDTGYQDLTALHRGGVYYAPPGGGPLERKASIPMPNGIGLSPDGKTVYVSDTLFGRLWALDLDENNAVKPSPAPGIMAGRVVATLPGFQWVDSLKVEAGGKICVATLFTGAITVFTDAPADPYGFHGQTEPVPVPPEEKFPTNLCFAGADMQDVFITASSTGRILKTRWPRPGLKLAFNA